jgi:Cu/Ag efflux protein CusF
MIRLLVLAITALMAVSATAASATELTVKVAGKAVPQVHADIVEAAKTVCHEDLGETRFGEDLMPYCVRDVAQAAIIKVNSPALFAYDKAQRRSAYLMKISR